ncbi:phosphoesterase [Frankia sp. CcI49]|nr:phosphoesterase [Frankia sp. CcI49]
MADGAAGRVAADGLRALDRRSVLRGSAAAAVGTLMAPAWLTASAGTAAAASTTTTGAAEGTAGGSAAAAFVDAYRTNTTADLTAAGNAAVRILDGMAKLWQTGTAWNTGSPLRPDVLRENMRYTAEVTRRRTDAQARDAFIYDRQHQSYAVIAALGPLAALYKEGALAVTSITSAPDGTPPAKIDDAVPAGAPAGSAIGAGSVSSALGNVVTLVNTVRGPFASSNPSKFSYLYPRPWRMTERSEIVDTGAVDDLGFPVYRSEVTVAAQLLRQRSTVPAEDGGFPSGHTNAFHLAALALAYAVPERFQELVARAYELSNTRILAGMHSPVDVIGGRILATALAAATLGDPANAALKVAARAQATQYFTGRTGTTADTLFAYAHTAAPGTGTGTGTDAYASREANARRIAPFYTYMLRRSGPDRPLVVPKGAEVLLETRLPYLSADQRRAVLRSTALPGGYPLLDGTEQWGRLDLFTAADGYGAFDGDVSADLDASLGGFHAHDTWRNDIGGRGGLVKTGSGTLALTGANSFTGTTTVRAGTLTAGSAAALGRGDVRVDGGVLRVEATKTVQVRGDLTQTGGALEVTVGAAGAGREAPLRVERAVRLGGAATLTIRLDPAVRSLPRGSVPVLTAASVRGRFTQVTVLADGVRAVVEHGAREVSVRLLPV